MIRQGEALRAAGREYLAGAQQQGARPVAVGQKFDPAGGVLRFAGNTFLCHIDPESPAHAALTEASLALQQGPLAQAFTFLPPSSFHMTVFEGVCDAHRSGDRWPEGLGPDTPLDQVTDAFSAATARLALPQTHAIRPTGIFAGFSVAVSGADAGAEASLRQTRQALRAATGIRRADFDSYDFHITLGYLLHWLTPDQAEAVLDLSQTVFARLLSRAPVIPLGPVEFCRFDDMHAFRLIRHL
ncbi:MAG: DUF1868 domain-containing protein [Rhodobacteraceae bacterium]|nr:DUF1868 domain-containing protein [Paracoccaceae bacterium]